MIEIKPSAPTFQLVDYMSFASSINRLLSLNRCLLISRLGVVVLIAMFTTPAQTALVSGVIPLPVLRKDSRILFQGDSITDGNRGRNLDPNHILGHGYAFIIAARYGAGFPELNLTFLNRGMSGNTVEDLAKRWPADTLDLKPDIVSILVGVNDSGRNVPFDQFEETYDRLLGDTRAANPNVRLVLGAPFLLAVGKAQANFETRRADIQRRQEIVAKLAAKHRAALVRYQPVFDAACQKAPADHWIWDGVHPTYSGHQLMADEWVRAVREFWPAP
jgi:lysophospholipase L1-like esterase